MLWTFIIFIAGLLILIKSSEVTINNSIRLSKLIGISEMVIGFIFLAVATSLPELAVAIVSSFQGKGILGIGVLFGANVIDITLLFGVLALISSYQIVRKDFEKILDAIILTSIVAFFALILGTIGLVFGVFCLLMFFLFSDTIMKKGIVIAMEKPEIKTPEMLKTIFMIFSGIAIVVISAKFVTSSALEIARLLNVYDSLIGATIIPIGTTLPEISVSVAALRKMNVQLAIGNAIGTIATNLLLIIGIAAVLSPIVIGPVVSASIIYFILVSGLFIFLARKGRFGVTQGLILCSAYVIFLLLMIVVGGL